MTALGEEMLVVSLSQREGRNTRGHYGVRPAFNDTIPRGFSKPWRRGPLFDRAKMIASGALVPDGVPAADLPLVARVRYRHIRDNSG